MIERQVQAVRDCMLRIIFSYSDNPIVRHLGESALKGFVQVNSINQAYLMEVDIQHAAWMELPRCLDIAIKSRDVWLQSISLNQIAEWGDDYFDVLEADDELAEIKIRTDLMACPHL